MAIKSLIIGIGLVVSVCFCNKLNAQNFQNLATEHGLSSNYVNTIVQDTFGLIWVGTQNGLNSYDGYQIKSYQFNPDDPNSLSNNNVSKLLILDNNDIIIATHNGVNIYNRSADNFTRIYNSNDDFGTQMNNYINDISVDQMGDVWIAATTGLYRLDLEKLAFVPHFNYSIHFRLNKNVEDKLFDEGISVNIRKKLLTINNTFYKDSVHLSSKLLSLLGEIDFNNYSALIHNVITQGLMEESFFASSVNAMHIDNNNRLWLGLSNGHIVMASTTDRNYKVAHLNEKLDFEANIICIKERDNKLWFSSIAKGYLFDIQKWEMVNPKNQVLESLLAMRNLDIELYNDSIFWFGCEEGVFKYNPKSETAKLYQNRINTRADLNLKLVNDLFVDQQEHLWIGTHGGGLNKMNKLKQFHNFKQNLTVPSAISNNKAKTVFINTNGDVWVGYYTGGIEIYDAGCKLKNTFIADANDNNGIGGGTINGITADKSGVVWISSYFGGIQYYNSKLKQFQNFNMGELSQEFHPGEIVCDNENNLWVSMLGQGLARISPDRKTIQYINTSDTTFNNPLPNSWVMLLYPDNSGNIILLANSVLYKLNQADKTIELLITDKQSFKHQIHSVFEDSKRNLFVGTNSGLYKVFNKGKLVKNFNDSVLLKGYVIKSIVQDNKGFLWVGSNDGLFKLSTPDSDTKSEQFDVCSHYKVGDGLPYNGFMNNSAFAHNNGKMVFGTENGFTYFTPDNIKNNTQKPNVLITDFKLFNKSIIPGEKSYLKKHISLTDLIELPYNQNFMSFSFAAINHINTMANQYAYKMEGVDDDWIYIGNKREANYTQLSHGSYVLRVKASNNDGVWNEEGAMVRIEIAPPFWKTDWALLLYVVVFSLLLAAFSLIVRNKEQFKAQVELDRVNAEKANEINKMKLQFFTNISHEFRTPLTLIMGPVESLIQEGKGSVDKLKLILGNAKKLLGLIDQIMDIRKLNSGKMEMKPELCNMVEYVQHLSKSFDYQCQIKGIELKFENSSDQIETVVDKSMIETIVNNLLSNAIKHTAEKGEIKVGVNYSNKPPKGFENNGKEFLKIQITDNGTGIPAEDIEHVFDRFFQSSHKIDGGSGVGLTLVKELTEIHKGKVTLQSTEGIGSEFTVYLPINKNSHFVKNDSVSQAIESQKVDDVKQTETVETKTSNEEEVIEPQIADLESALPLVLVVEDNKEVRDYTVSELKTEYRVIEAVNGKEGMQLAGEKYPDVIITDYMMPEMDGIEMCKMLKADETTSHIPIILLTAYNNESTNIAGYETGAESFLAKPFSPKVLKSRVKNIIQNRQRLKEKFSNILYSAPSNKSLNPIDEEFIRKAISFVEEHLSEENFSIDFMCKQLGYSRTALYSKIKTLTDQSISEFIKLIRLKKSIEHFRNENKSINEVAFLVGFKTHSHFSRCFSEEFEMSPTEYLAKLNNEPA